MKYVIVGAIFSLFLCSSQLTLAETDRETLKTAEQKQKKVKEDDGSIPTVYVEEETHNTYVDDIPELEEETDSKSNRKVKHRQNEPIRRIYDQL